MRGASIFSAAEAAVSVKFLELDGWEAPGDGFCEVSVTLPRFAIDEMREWLPRVFRGSVSWLTTNYHPLKFFVPNTGVGRGSASAIPSVAAFSQAVMHTQQSWELYLKLRDKGAPHEDCWTLVPERWMWQLWRFQCPARLMPEMFCYAISNLTEEGCDSLSAEGLIFAKWLVEAITEAAEAQRVVEGGAAIE